MKVSNWRGGRFGKAWLFKCVPINGAKKVRKCAVISPKRTHYKRVIEIISPAYLRDKLEAKDGDSFVVQIDLGDV